MNITHDFLQRFWAAVCCILIPFVMWAQEEWRKGFHDPPSGYVMKFERMGGYIGLHDEFWIYPDGRVLNAMGKKAKIHPTAVGEWLKNISPIIAQGSMATIVQQSLCMDCFVYRIILYDKGGTKALTFADPLKSEPASLATDLGQMRDQLFNLLWK